MRGVYLPGGRRVDVREVADPEPGPGQVVVGVRASTICGSDQRRALARELGAVDVAVEGPDGSADGARTGPDGDGELADLLGDGAEVTVDRSGVGIAQLTALRHTPVTAGARWWARAAR